MKIKLLSLPSEKAEILVGEGVTNIDSKIIDNSLRVPIYDKKQGVQEVALCSVDFFVTGFSIQKNSFSYINKSRSKIDDQRDRSQDAVFSQMSYTLQSQSHQSQRQESNKSKKQSNKNINNSPREKQSKERFFIPSKQIKETGRISNEDREKDHKNRYKNEQRDKDFKDSHKLAQFYDGNLQNSVYLKNNTDQSFKKRQKQHPKYTQNKLRSLQSEKKYENQLLNSSENYPSNIKNQSLELSPQKLKIQVAQNQKILQKLKNFLKKQERQSQLSQNGGIQKNKTKLRRKKIKIEAIQSYKYQNNFIKYHNNIENKPLVLLKNVRAIRIIQNEIKQVQSEIIKQPINKLVIAYNNNQKIITFDALGYRSYCISNGIQENSIDIHIPFDENSLKIGVNLNDQGDFEGILGLQEGEDMAIRIYRKNNQGKGAILTKEIFKLYCDIKPINSPSKKQTKSNKILDQTYRENQDLFTHLNFKQRIQTISIQPWVYIQNKIKKTNRTSSIIQKQTNQIAQNYNYQPKQFNHREQEKYSKILNKKIKKGNNLSFSQNNKLKSNKYITSDENQNESQMINEQQKYLKRQKAKEEIFVNQNTKIKEINNIRNGNRNNYRYKKREQQKIKELWQDLLIKKKLQEDQKVKKQLQVYRNQFNNSIARNKNTRQYSKYSSLKSQSLTNQSKKFKIIPLSKPKKYHIKTQQEEQEEEMPRPLQYPITNLILQINNISITQPKLLIIDEDSQYESGKFVKIGIKDKVDYYTEVIFNGEYNSILWKLQGCLFNELDGNERLQLQLYNTIDNKIKIIGKSLIRLKKLIFLRNNHIYNGKIISEDMVNGQFTIGFNIYQNVPFQIIKEDQNQNHQFQHQRNRSAILGNYIEQRIKPYSLTNKIKNNNINYIQSVGKQKNNDQPYDIGKKKHDDLMNTLKKNLKSNINNYNSNGANKFSYFNGGSMEKNNRSQEIIQYS